MTEPTLALWSDDPARVDLLSFDVVAKTVADALLDEHLTLFLTAWGIALAACASCSSDSRWRWRPSDRRQHVQGSVPTVMCGAFAGSVVTWTQAVDFAQVQQAGLALALVALGDVADWLRRDTTLPVRAAETSR